MTETAVIAKMIASNFEAIPNNAPLTYMVSHHPPFQCGTVGDLLSLIGKLTRPHEMTAVPLDLDALEEFIFCADPRASADRDAVYVMLRNAAPALFAAARERDKLRSEGYWVPLHDYEVARSENTRLREALEAAVKTIRPFEISIADMPPEHFYISIKWRGNALLGIRGRHLRAVRDFLFKARAALGREGTP